MKLFKILSLVFIILVSLVLLLWLIRSFSEVQLDDITPGIPCDKELMYKADAFYVIPNFEGNNISENSSWCEYILSFNKDLRLHGFTHSYREFGTTKDKDYLEESIKTFEDCFNQTPSRFKAPQIMISDQNKKMAEESLRLDHRLNQLFHKVYHCNDSGWPYNWFNDLF